MWDDDVLPGEHPNRGWNRATIRFWSRGPHKPNISAEDLLLPSGRGSLKLLGICAIMAVSLSFLWVYVLLYLINFFVSFHGPPYAAVLGGSVVVLTAVLYLLATRETKRDRELAARL